jgi:transcription initiation factor TFIIIB Brf1 subunit/transcription initiation factor TFIIB
MRTRKMLATVAVATVAVAGVTGGSAASAATGSQSGGKGSVAVAAKAKPGPDRGDQDRFLRKIAASLHVSLAELKNALRDMKTTSIRLGAEPTDPRVVAVFVKDLGISDAEARAVVKEIVGQPGPVKSRSGKTPSGKTPSGKTPPSKSPSGEA